MNSITTETRAVNDRVIRCDRLAEYVGKSGQRSQYPLREGMEAPASITMTSGEVRELRVVVRVTSGAQFAIGTATAVAS